MACHCFSQTTPTKSFLTTTLMKPGMPLTELHSLGELTTVAPTVGGRTTRPCTMPGTRTLCTYSNVPVTIAGMSRRLTGLPSTVHSRGGLRFAFVFSARLNFLPPISSP